MDKETTNSEIRKGLLSLAVLRAIGAKKCYTAELIEILRETEFATQEGTLYPLLSKLKREGFIDHTWVESKNGPPRKYYELNTQGRQKLKELETYLEKIFKDIQQIGERNA